jgi:acyl-coenzyme A synthetase/AMP-(fatty) acid ligase
MEYAGHALPAEREGSFGRQVGKIERAILDPETAAPLSPGAVGEIALRGGHLMLGMQDRSHDESFDADGWYHTGDLGRIDEAGYLYFHGRRGDMIKCKGANIAPQEIEGALLALPMIQEAIAVALPDLSRGEILAAAVVLVSGAAVTDAAIKAELAENLSSYKVPRHIIFVTADEIPRTPTAKVQRNALRTLIAQRVQSEAAPELP